MRYLVDKDTGGWWYVHKVASPCTRPAAIKEAQRRNVMRMRGKARDYAKALTELQAAIRTYKEAQRGIVR